MQALGVWEQLRHWTLPAGQGCPRVGGRSRWLCRCVPDVSQMCPRCAAGRRRRQRALVLRVCGREAEGGPSPRVLPVRGLGGLLPELCGSCRRERVPHTGGRGISVASLDPPASGRSPAASLGQPRWTLLTQSTSSPCLLPLQSLGCYPLCDSYLLLVLFPCHSNTNYTFSSLLILVSCSDEPPRRMLLGWM